MAKKVLCNQKILEISVTHGEENKTQNGKNLSFTLN